MKRISFAGIPGTLLFLLTLARAAIAAQEKPVVSGKDMTETVKITLTGEVDLDYVWRRNEITAFTGGVGANVPGDSSSENTFEGFVAMRLNVDLSDKVSALLEFGTKRADAGKLAVFAAPSGTGSTALSLQLREANISVAEMFMPELRMQIGISTWNFDLRGKGQSMAFDPRHSQRFDRNVNPGPDSGVTLNARAGDYQELEPVGVWLRYGREKLVLDLIVLPAVIEGGSPHGDEAFYALDLLYKIDDKESRFGFIASVTTDPGGSSVIFTYGGGADWRGTANLDVYGEVYFQNGRNNDGITPTVDIGAFAYQVGAEYRIPGDAMGWVGVNLTYFSGDSQANGKSSSFTAYENIHDLLILEDMYLGFDWDTNYRAIKIAGGLSANVGGKANLRLSAMIGLCQTARNVQFAALPVPESTRKLGNEVDVKAEWDLTKQLTLNAGIGFLFGSEVLENSMGGKGAPDASQQALLFTLGTDLRF
ncbi:MAG TPA: hypothetical protein VE981_08590 [Planctomycetota bacterium]|nr:hypothetical protein [Planctomycetota bacterium]